MRTTEAGLVPSWALRLRRTFQVQPAETLPLLLLLLHGFAKGLTFVYFETTANATFLASYGPELLPYVYVTVALVSASLGFALTWIESQLAPARFLWLTLTFLLASIVGVYLLLELVPARWPAFVMMVWKDVVFIIVELVFWAVAGYLFNVRQGKRLFGLAGAGAIFAGIIGGLCTPLLISLVGNAQLLVVAALGALTMLITLVIITRRFAARFTPEEDDDPDADWSLRALARRPYILLMAAFSVLSFYCYYTVDLAFYGEVERHWQDPEALASFFGIFYAALNAAMLLTSGLVVGRMILRYGLPIGLMLVPALEYLGTLSALGAMVLAGGAMLAIIILLKLLDEVARATFEGNAYRLLYQAMPGGVRLRVQAVRESIVEPVGVGVSGLIFLGATQLLGLNGRELLLALLVVVPIWIVIALKLRANYTIELGKTLSERKLDRGDLNLDDSAARTALEETLKDDGHRDEALHAIDLLEDLSADELRAYLDIAFQSRHTKVRAAALRKAGARGIDALGWQAARIAEDETEEACVRGAALEVLGVLAPGHGEIILRRHLDDKAPEVWAGALAGMLKAGGGSAEEARGRLARLIKDDPSERLLAAEVIEMAAVQHASDLLEPLLDASQPDEVRNAAVRATGALQDPELLPLLIRALTDPPTQVAAQDALVAFGNAAIPALEQRLTALYGDPAEHAGGLLRHSTLLRMVSRIGESAVSLIYPYLDLYDADHRHMVIGLLAYCDHTPPDGESDRLYRQLLLEASAIAWLKTALADLDMDIVPQRFPADLSGDDGILAIPAKPRKPVHVLSALAADMDRRRSNLILLLAALIRGGDRQQRERILSAHQRFFCSSADLRDAALELIENLLPDSLKAIAIPVLVDGPEGAPGSSNRLLGRSLGPVARLMALAPRSLFSSPWTRAVVMHTIGEMGLAEARALIWETILDREPIVREAALWCALRLRLPPSQRKALRELFRNDANAALGELAERLLNDQPSEGQPMLSTIEKVLKLKSVEIFSGIAEQQLIELATRIEEKTFAPEQPIFTEGDKGDDMHVIVSGRVRVHKGDVEIRLMGAGMPFGEMAALDPEPRSASVTAVEPTRTFRISGASINRLIEQNPSVARAIIRVLCQRQRASERQRFGKQPSAGDGPSASRPADAPFPSVTSTAPSPPANPEPYP